jgi:phage recombination protein Bet
MSLAIRNDQSIDIWSSGLSQIKEIYGKNLSSGEFETFVQIGKATGLNPFLREIWAVKYGNNPAQIFIGRDGYRKSAQANKDYDYHHVDAVYNNDEFHFDLVKGEVKHHYNFKDRGKLMGSYCLVKRKNSTKPIFVFVEIGEYNKGQSVWKDKPATMIKKVAEAQSLRMAFQELFGGTYDESERWDNKNNIKHVKPINVEPLKIENDNMDEMDFKTDILNINDARSLGDLENVYRNSYKFWAEKRDKERLAKIIAAKDEKKKALEDVKSFNDEIDAQDTVDGEADNE